MVLYRYYGHFVLTLFLLVPVLSSGAEAIQKSPNDPRQYELITLPNQLQALIISDPDTDKASASLAVAAGSGSDPEDRQGLAHFLEHMLFLGTEKYPEPAEYKNFISTHGGGDNAYTALDHTNYYFDIDKEFLEPALDRFARFFIDPLFIAKYVDNERQIVHSEYQSKLKSDGWRIRSAQRWSGNAKHPFTKFNVGSLETLADRPGSDIRDELVNFYRRYYSANLMSLAVLGKEPLPQLKQWVMEKFSAVENRNAQESVSTEPLYLPEQLPARMDVIPIKEERRLTLAFPIPAARQYYQSKPINYISNLLGHEGKGSLLSLLKDKGWANSLWTGLSYSDDQQALLNISIGLTQAGLPQVNDIVTHVFQYLQLIEQQGITQWLFEEQQRLAEISFRFQEKSAAINATRSLAASLRHYPAADLLRGPYAIDRYDAPLIQRFLAALKPDKLLLTVSAPGLATDAEDPWFQVPYKITAISAKQQQRWQNPLPDPALLLPEPNSFIPDDISLKNPENATTKPQRLAEVDFEFWMQQDDTYRVPRNEFYFAVRSPLANNTPEHAMLTELYVKVVDDILSEFSYPAYLAGLEYRLYKHIRGFTVRISGYNNKQPFLLKRIVETLKHPRIDADRFTVIKAGVMRRLQNASREVPFRQLMSEVTDLLIQPYWGEQRSIAALEPLAVVDLERFIPQLLSESEVVALSNGNVDITEALQLAAILQDYILADAKRITVEKGQLLQLGEGADYVRQLDIDHHDSALTMYFQGPDKSYRSLVTFALLGQLLESPFFDDIRTEKRLGYTVFAYAMPLLRVPGLMFVVQSPIADPLALEQYIQDFLDNYLTTLQAMDETEFQKHKQALLAKILEKEKTLKDRSDRYWTEIDRKQYHFDSQEQWVKTLVNINKTTVLEAYRRYLLDDKRQRLVVRSVGTQHSSTFSGKDDNSPEQLITDVAAFKKLKKPFSG